MVLPVRDEVVGEVLDVGGLHGDNLAWLVDVWPAASVARLDSTDACT